MTPAIELRGVTKRFLAPSGGIYTALRDLNFEVEPGEFCAVVGPTGCGKSTTLALISGLEPPSEGEVEVFGQSVGGIAEGIGYVFQSDAVFPWKTVLENVAAGPRYQGMSHREARVKARDWITRVGLAGFEDRYPYQLSGGMRKRVALAQSLINGPRILLMDEPFSALDVQTRSLMETELLSLWSASSASVVFVTHDLEEAISLSDRVFVITASPGTVKSTYKVDLPRPRNVAEIRFDPRFIEIYEEIWKDLKDEVLVTMEETVGGFIVGSIFGVVFGVVLGSNRLLSDVLSPYIKGANAIPRVVVGALFAVSLGLDIKSKIATASVLVFFVVFFNAFQGVREVDRNLVANARILGADDRRLTTEIIIPSALSWIVR